MIEIEGILQYRTNSAQRPSEDSANLVMQQIARDAVYGTFGEFPRFWNNKWEIAPHLLAEAHVAQQSEWRFGFTLCLTESMFPVDPAGIQHLLGILAGDTFEQEFPGSPLERIEVTEVVLPEEMQNLVFAAFRKDRAHDIDAIRNVFQLGEMEPLLAFSFKPRVGIRFEEVERVAIGVLKSGFHLVEMDTRYLLVDDSHITQLISLAEKAASLRTSHVTRFAPNISVPSDTAASLARQFLSVQPHPVVVKIDGGLDGVSACQRVRREFCRAATSSGLSGGTPVITCYPLLRGILRNRIPEDFFIRCLALSGVDIIYPGGRPRIGSVARSLGTAESGRLVNSVERYRRLVKTGWPMPTIAGGVYAGELHAFYEMLGPSVAYFLGGAVALHRDGPIEGAKLCARTISSAIDMRSKSSRTGQVGNLNANLIKEIENAYRQPRHGRGESYAYVSPGSLIESTPGLNSWFSVRT